MKKIFAYIMGVTYLFAGFNHFWHTTFYTKMVDGFLPYPVALVYISGVAEMLCGLGLLIPATRKAAAWGTIALLVAITPAHFNMIIHHEQWPDVPLWGLYLRLPIQLLLIWWAWIYTKD
jgi:uncharacterized membrane protein